MSNSVLLQGDCLEMLKQLPDNSVDSLITDPPAGISFMGKSWDEDKGGRAQWIKWMSEVMTECLRVLKPGAHGLVWAIPRTSHWTATALEDAGFEIRDSIEHIFSTGFPKSHNIEKAIGDSKFSGIGTALKPAHETWWLVRKPCSEKTVAANVLLHSTGGINIDASRVGLSEGEDTSRKVLQTQSWKNTSTAGVGSVTDDRKKGRFPANLIFSHNPDCVEVGTKIGNGDSKLSSDIQTKEEYSRQGFGVMKPDKSEGVRSYCTETISAFECTEGCAVAELDRQSGVSKSNIRKPNGKNLYAGNSLLDSTTLDTTVRGLSDSGGASRFFYCAKASKKDKGEGNNHPTPKNTTLMTYLIKMITPPEGIVLDPFTGSGSTGVAAVKNGFAFIGIEKEQEYYDIAEKRIQGATKNDRESDSSEDDSAA
jgi:site-specific DNA-methyltransferase (adenine-specific)